MHAATHRSVKRRPPIAGSSYINIYKDYIYIFIYIHTSVMHKRTEKHACVHTRPTCWCCTLFRICHHTSDTHVSVIRSVHVNRLDVYIVLPTHRHKHTHTHTHTHKHTLCMATDA